MTQDIFAELYGYKGYILKIMTHILWGKRNKDGDQTKKNMKGMNLSQIDKIMLSKRAIIEWVNAELTNICKLQHTRHRSINNLLLNILGPLAAYTFFPKILL